MPAHAAIQHLCLGIAAPGTAQIHFIHIRVSCQVTILEQVAVRLARRCGACRDIARTIIVVPQAADFAMLEISRRTAKNKIYRTFYVAMGIQLAVMVMPLFEGDSSESSPVCSPEAAGQ